MQRSKKGRNKTFSVDNMVIFPNSQKSQKFENQ